MRNQARGEPAATSRGPRRPCTVPLACRANEDDKGTVIRNRADDVVTVSGSGAGSLGSAVECRTKIPVQTGDEISFSYDLAEGTAPCGGGTPACSSSSRTAPTKNTIDSDPQCAAEDEDTVTYEIQGTGTVVGAGFVYDRGDTGPVTYSDAVVGG